MAKDIVKAIPLTTVTVAGLDSNLAVVNGTGLDEACFYLRFLNNSDTVVFISLDDVNYQFALYPEGGELVLNAQTNSQPHNYRALFSKNQKIYAAAVVAGTGSVYISGLYQDPT